MCLRCGLRRNQNIWTLQSATTRKFFQVAEQTNPNLNKMPKTPENKQQENYFNGHWPHPPPLSLGQHFLAKVSNCVPAIHKFSACWQSGHIAIHSFGPTRRCILNAPALFCPHSHVLQLGKATGYRCILRAACV